MVMHPQAPHLPVIPSPLHFLPAPSPSCHQRPPAAVTSWPRAFPALRGKGGEKQSPNCCVSPAFSLQLTGGGCRCTGMLEVQQETRWSRLCWSSLMEARGDHTCQQLGCGPSISKPLQTIVTGGKEPQMRLEKCRGSVLDPSRCQLVPANCTQQVLLSCRGESGPPHTQPGHPHPTTPPPPVLTCSFSSHFRAGETHP